MSQPLTTAQSETAQSGAMVGLLWAMPCVGYELPAVLPDEVAMIGGGLGISARGVDRRDTSMVISCCGPRPPAG